MPHKSAPSPTPVTTVDINKNKPEKRKSVEKTSKNGDVFGNLLHKVLLYIFRKRK